VDDVTTLDVWEARPANQAPRWLPSEPSKKGHSPTRRNALRGLQSLLTIRQRAEFDRRPNARKVLDTLVVGRPDQERLDGPCRPTAASIWVLTSTSCGIVPQPADEGQDRGREKAADEQSGERASRRAMRPIPTPTDRPEISRLRVPPASTLAVRPAPDACPGPPQAHQCSSRQPVRRPPAPPGSSSIGARPTRRPFVHTATTMPMSKVDPRIPSNTAATSLLGPSHGHVANRVSGGGADRLVELLGQTGVRKRVSRYLMTSHSVIPPTLDAAARVFGPLSRWNT
jgi:hypothetical protein